MPVVQRHLYAVLLFAATTLAVTFCLRPHLGVALMAKAGTLLDEGTLPPGTPPATARTPGNSNVPPARPSAGGRPAAWPVQADDSDQAWEGEVEPYQPPDDRRRPDPAPQRQPPPLTPPNWWPDRPPLAPSQPAPLRDDRKLPAGGPSAIAPEGEYEPWPPRAAPDRFAPQTPAPPYRSLYSASPQPEPPPRPRPPGGPVTVLPTEEAPRGPGAPGGEDGKPVDANPCEGAQIVARVGTQAVLMSDVWVAAEQVLAAMYHRDKEKIKESLGQITPETIAQQRDALVQAQFQGLVGQLVQNKLVYYDAISTIPAEGQKNIEEQLGKIFEKGDLPRLMEFYQAKSPRELDHLLMAGGTSVQRHRRAFMERTLSSQWVASKIKINEEVGHEEMLAYYQEHAADFERPLRARWEQIAVRTSKYRSREEARAALARAGNQVLDGRPLADVAREMSDGATAAQGGGRDWTTKGSLVSKTLDEALFALPVGRLSPILDDGEWLHIVRVVEREDGQRTPFEDAQVKIREEIRKRRDRIQQQAFVDRLRERVPVWTILDERTARQQTPGQGL